MKQQQHFTSMIHTNSQRAYPSGGDATNPPLRDNRVSAVYDALRELIIWGRLGPGTRILEREIAARLEVSRTPVRSALHRLQQEGYIHATQTAGGARLVVAPLTRADACELFDIVGQLEGLAARGAARLGPLERAKLVQELKILNADLYRAAVGPRRDRNEIFNLDTAFHRAYVEAGAGPRLLALHDAIKPQAERYVRIYISALLDEIGKSVEEHAATISGIETGEARAAEEAVKVNWQHAAERFAAVIDSVGERGVW